MKFIINNFKNIVINTECHKEKYPNSIGRKIFFLFTLLGILLNTTSCAMFNKEIVTSSKAGSVIEITEEVYGKGKEGEKMAVTNSKINISKSNTVESNKKNNNSDVDEDNDVKDKIIVCEIKGEVMKPGVYSLILGSRVNDLLIEAGGAKKTAKLDFTNLARKLSDGEAVFIPDRSMSEEEYNKVNNVGKAMEEASNNTTKPTSSGESKDSKVNINTASQSELESIPGVGPVTAGNIIKYRENSGPFNAIEDIKKVDRIGDKTFEKLKDHIKVK